LPDIACRVVVGWRSEAATDALEVVPRFPIRLVDQAAPRASSARVAWIDKHDCNAFKRRLVDDQRSQLVETPVCHPCPLAPLNLDPIPDAFEVFEGNQAPAAFGVGSDGFAQDVVSVALKARLFAAIALERASRGTTIDLLQSMTPRFASPANYVDLLAGIRFTGIVNGKINDAHVDSEHILDFNKRLFFGITSRSYNPLFANKQQIYLPLGTFQHFSLTTTADEHDP